MTEADFNVYGFIFQAPTADAPLTITKLVVGATEEGVAGLGATFTDANPNGKVSDYSATISWGDGTTSTGRVVKNPQGGFAVLAAHQYAASGTYTLTLTINDSGGSSVTATKTLVVPPDRD